MSDDENDFEGGDFNDADEPDEMEEIEEGATYGPRATSGPRRLIFLALTLPFWLKCGPRDINKGAMWPADENSCPPLL